MMEGTTRGERMASRVVAAEVAGYVGREITVAGWVHRVRELGKVSFVVLRDRSGLLQIVYEGAAPASVETVISVRGTVAENSKAAGGFELRAGGTEMLGPADSDLPIAVNGDPGSIALETLLDNRMLSLRMPEVRAIFELQSEIVALFSEALRKRGFTEIKTSKLVGSGTEGGTGLFQVDYFGEPAYLAQSPQLYKQAMVASGLERVFEIGAAYRAEKHDTPRHLNEYVSLDVELAFIDGIDDLIDLEIEILTHICEGLAQSSRSRSTLARRSSELPSADALRRTPRIDHETAKRIASDRTGTRLFELNPRAERALCDWAAEEHGIDAVFVTGFPRKKRPFYTRPEAPPAEQGPEADSEANPDSPTAAAAGASSAGDSAGGSAAGAGAPGSAGESGAGSASGTTPAAFRSGPEATAGGTSTPAAPAGTPASGTASDRGPATGAPPTTGFAGHSGPGKRRARATASFDLLFRGLEITTGGMRIHEHNALLEALRAFGMQPEALSDYLNVFRYGCPPHGGFAIGLERLTQKLLGLENVKEASAFPRDRKRLRP